MSTIDLEWSDHFCGAGGSSVGLKQAGGRLRLAMNHWEVACQSYATNHVGVEVVRTDIASTDPRRFARTALAWFSPECRYFSQSRSKKHVPTLFDQGSDEAAERSRALMWDVPRFAAVHRYEAIVVENVVEITRPPAPFPDWLREFEKQGYRWRVVSLNSMVAHPTPQSRDRVYIVFWRKGNRAPDLEFTAASWCPHCERRVEGRQVFKPNRTVGKYRDQYLYRCPDCQAPVWPFAFPASSAIDWSIIGERIGDRSKPLVEATMRRIELGLRLFFPDPFVAQRFGHTFERPGYAVCGRAMPTQTTTLAHGLVVPTRGDSSVRARSDVEPWPTQTGRAEQALVVPLRKNGRARRADVDVCPTVTSGAGSGGQALVIKNYGRGDDPSMIKPTTLPLGTVTGQDHHSLLGLPFTLSYYRTNRPSPVCLPIGTITTVDRHALVEPAVAVEDCTFRMFEPAEVKRGMAIPTDYTLVGNKRDQIRQCGNAVTPPASCLIGERIMASLA